MASDGSGVKAFGEGGCYDCWKPRQFMAWARIHGKRVTGSCPTQFATPDTNRSGSGDAKSVDSGAVAEGIRPLRKVAGGGVRLKRTRVRPRGSVTTTLLSRQLAFRRHARFGGGGVVEEG